MEKILVIDNYDSFTYNLVQYINELTEARVTVLRNDQFRIKDVEQFDRMVLSPGPGLPEDAGLLKEVIRQFGPTRPILGVCLGHQAIAEVYGARLVNLSGVYHGVATRIFQTGEKDPLLTGLPDPFMAGRYHSWVVEGSSLPQELLVTASDPDGYIMALRHSEYHLFGLQFHPESILTPEGMSIIKNFLKFQGK